ncbi:hypothetical protein ABPG72_007141 [Tetrahymena utriculariae]
MFYGPAINMTYKNISSNGTCLVGQYTLDAKTCFYHQSFQKYYNYPALGIGFNNVGCINFNSARYNEAFDYFSQAIICCKYDLKLYREQVQDQQQNYFGKQLNQEEPFQVINYTQLSKTQKSQIFDQFNKEKINSYFFYKNNTDSSQSNKNQPNQIQIQKIKSNQIDLFKIHKDRALSSKQADFFDTYFFRTVNYLKSMIYCMCLNMNVLADWLIGITQECQLNSDQDFLDPNFPYQQRLSSQQQKNCNLNYEGSIAFSLQEDILNQIISQNDDYFGFINSNYSEMIIEEPILMTNFYYIKNYKNYWLKQLNDYYFNKEDERILNDRGFLNKNLTDFKDSVSSKSHQLNNINNQRQKQQQDSNQWQKTTKLEDLSEINLDKQQIQTIVIFQNKTLYCRNNIQVETLIKRKDLFYYTIRKAIQQVISQNEGKSILLKIQQIIFDQDISNSHIINQYDQSLKNSYMQNSLFPNLMKKIIFKKIIVAAIENINIFSQNEMEFQFILQNMYYYDVELCIVIVDENISTKKSNQYRNITIEKKNVVSFFHNSQSLLVYLNSNRYSKFHDSTLLYSENF